MASMNYLDYCVKYMAGQIYLVGETNRRARFGRNRPATCRLIILLRSVRHRVRMVHELRFFFPNNVKTVLFLKVGI